MRVRVRGRGSLNNNNLDVDAIFMKFLFTSGQERDVMNDSSLLYGLTCGELTNKIDRNGREI